MSQGYYPPVQNPPPAKSSQVLWIVLGVVGAGLALMFVVCCGGVVWFAQSPAASAAAKQPFEFASVPVPQFVAGKETTEDGVRFREVMLQGGGPGAGGRLWVYRPEAELAPRSATCVLIAGAGSTMLTGMSLGDGDQDEHYPYVKAGFVVVAYDLDGEDTGDAAGDYAKWKASRAGLVNARNALEYTLQQLPEVNPQRVFAAGHSSAASHALLFAAHEPRLAGVAAYAPCVNIPQRMPGVLVRVLQAQMPGLVDFLTQSSPHTHEARLACPVFLFGAADDDNTPLKDTQAFADRLKSQGKEVTLETVAHGGHYESMIADGIPRGIEWMKNVGAAP